jgi:Histidine kinase
MRKIKLNDKWLRIVGMPFMGIFGRWLFYESRRVQTVSSTFFRYSLSVCTAVLLWEGFRQIIIFVRGRYPESHRITQRIFLQLILFLFGTILLRLLAWGVVFVWFGYNLYPTFYEFRYSVTVTYISIIPIAAVYEGVYFFQSWKIANIEVQELKKMNLQSQLESLKSEINSHFLFNNLNTLSSLIENAPDDAENFLDELSNVYRYLLQKKQSNLSLVSDEINFIKSYTYLLKTRYCDGFEVEIDVCKEYSNYQIPTLVLQSLVENAIKHNVISVRRPLKIKVYIQNFKIVIENTFQKKLRTVETSRMVLSSILQKYEILNKSKVEVTQNDEIFKVSLPLIDKMKVTYVANER